MVRSIKAELAQQAVFNISFSAGENYDYFEEEVPLIITDEDLKEFSILETPNRLILDNDVQLNLIEQCGFEDLKFKSEKIGNHHTLSISGQNKNASILWNNDSECSYMETVQILFEYWWDSILVSKFSKK